MAAPSVNPASERAGASFFCRIGLQPPRSTNRKDRTNGDDR